MVIIIEHDQQLLLNELENLVQQNVCGTFRLLRELLRLLQVREGLLAKVRHALLNSKREIAEENGRVSVGVIELIPNVGMLLLTNKIRDQRSLSGSGIRSHQRDRQRQVCLQSFNQMRSRQNLRRAPRRQQLGAQKEGARQRQPGRRCLI